jgi:hypothetical protein
LHDDSAVQHVHLAGESDLSRLGRRELNHPPDRSSLTERRRLRKRRSHDARVGFHGLLANNKRYSEP